jgi:hypothetical protein
VFDLINNSEEVCRFFIDLRQAMEKHGDVYINALRMEQITMESSLYLQALIHSDPGRNGCRVAGNFPNDNAVKRNWIHTGFFERLTTTKSIEKSKGEMTLCQGTEQDARAIRSVIVRAASKILGRDMSNPDDAPDLARSVLTEVNKICGDLRQNVVEHASGMDDRKAMWWVAVYPDTESESLKVCIADAGIGIMESVKVKKFDIDSSLTENLQRFSTTFEDNAGILQKVIGGEYVFRVSSTDEPHRGNGLRSIGTLAKKKFVDSIHVITNDVLGEVKSSHYKSLSYRMHGTIYVIKTNNIRTGGSDE